MRIKYFILMIIFLSLIACDQKKENAPVETNKPSIAPNEIKKDSLVFGNNIHDYILFGIYCGECGSHCATMFRYNMGGNSNMLFVDYTDSYFNNNGNVVCNTPMNGIEITHLANTVIGKIPSQLLTTIKPRERFGCPDCNDGCGIYFEFELAGKVKKFTIDTETSKLTPDIKAFSEFLQQVIGEMKKYVSF